MLDDEESFHQCSRTIRKSKYEAQDNETYYWWLKLFEIMENEIQIPQHQRKDVIQQIFPEEILKKVLSLMTVKSVVEQPALIEEPSLVQRRKSLEIDEKVGKDGSLGEREEVPLAERPSGVRPKEREVGRNNPFLRFFKQKPDRVAIWRDLPPIKLEDMNLGQKAVALTEIIAISFVKWLERLSGESKNTLDVQQVVKMFEVGFDFHAATSLEVAVKEMPSVTKDVANSMGVSEKYSRLRLKEKLWEDIQELKKSKRTRAFDTSLPREMRYVPPTVDHTKRWLEISSNVELTSMYAVWQGLTKLRATRAYCKWLMKNPQYPQPKYLVELGMLTPEYYLQPHYSVETVKSAGEVSESISALFHAHESIMYN